MLELFDYLSPTDKFKAIARSEREGGGRNSLDGWQFISLKPEAAAGSARLNARPDAFYMANSIAIDQPSQHPRNREKQQRLIDIPLDIEIVPIIKINTTLSRPCCLSGLLSPINLSDL